MTIVLRLQGLDVKAGIEDIRTFFKRLRIPEGGVYILGGSLGEAFVAFSSEKDAQLAMRLTGKTLKGSKVTLHISNMAELEQKLESLLTKKKSSLHPVKRSLSSQDANQLMNERNLSPQAVDLPLSMSPQDISTADLQQPLYFDTTNQQAQSASALDSRTAFLLGICTVLQGLQASNKSQDDTVPQVHGINSANTDVSDKVLTEEQNLEESPGYVRLFGLPASTTKDDLCQFFRGLAVQEAIVNVKLGLNHGCLVKFANVQDACDALLFNQHQLGNISVEVRSATEKMWTGALQDCENALNGETRVKRKRSPFRETANHKQRSPPSKRITGGPVGQLPLNSNRPTHDISAFSPTKEYVVKVSNLPTTMTKTEIKELFRCTSVPHKNVLHWLDKEGNRTDTAFIIFKRTEDYDYAMTLSGCHVGSAAIEVSSSSRFLMREMMAKTHPRNQNPFLKKDKKMKQRRSFVPLNAPDEPQSVNRDPAALTCLFVRNMPAHVYESQIKTFFGKYQISQDDIILLRDSNGKSVGEAVVQFGSAESAALAQRLHGQDFLGSEVLLTLITVKQMEDILRHELSAEIENCSTADLVDMK